MGHVRETSGIEPIGRTVTRLTVVVFLFTVMIAGPVKAGEILVDFEQYAGPSDYRGNATRITAGAAQFSGGEILTDANRIYYDPQAGAKVNASSVYAAKSPSPLVIVFDEPVSEISMQVMNRRTDGLIEFRDDSGNTHSVRLAAWWRAGSVTTVRLPFKDVRRLTIKAPWHRFGFFRVWDFAIDNVRFTATSGEYAISFSAFVPHDNVPAGPTASCLFMGDGGWMPPGLDRIGRVPGNNAIWNRSGSFAPGKGRGKGPQGRFPHLAGSSADELPGNKRNLFFAGDDRGFHPAAPSYRLRQLVTVIPDEALDPDGMQEGSIRNLAGEVRAYAEDAMADGIIDDADEDGVSDDCRLFHRAHLAETDHMNVSVTRTGPKSVSIRLSGTLDSPLAGPAEVLGAIDWNFTLTLDNSAEPGVWTLSGAHDGFPAYEIYINGQPVYQHDPGPAPYDFAKDVRKLLPPLDIAVMQVSGDLQ